MFLYNLLNVSLYYFQMNNVTLLLSTNSLSNDTNEVEDEIQVAGGPFLIFLLCLNTFGLSFYIFILFVMFRDKHFYSAYYRCVIALGFTDISILLSLMSFSLSYIGAMGSNENVTRFIRLLSDRFGDGLGYYPNLMINMLIGLNRFVAIVMFQSYKTIFSKKRTMIYIFVSLLIGCAYSFTFYYLITDFYQSMDGILTLIAVGISFTMYGIALVRSYIRIKSSDATGKNKLVREVKMTIQAVIIGAMLLITEIIYLETSTEEYYNAIFALFYTLYSGLTAPVVNLIFDKRLRKDVRKVLAKVFPFLEEKQVVTTVTTMKTQNF